MRYRREIDGLRAIALIPVILFHAGFELFSGGYIGVDVFFVISGYLITSILINELQQDKFSIVRFYERRARRILPALFLVMTCCVPFAWVWMSPSQFKDFAQSIVAVSLFASNILFWIESGYFAAASEMKPLLHTWSLAVEEQYYILFPIFLSLVWRLGKRPVLYTIIIIAAVSLLLTELFSRIDPAANFYLAPTRAWELLAGSICAFLQFSKEKEKSEVLSLFGFGLIIFSIFYFDKNTPFPSLYALAPVIGTALIVLYGKSETWVAKLLSTKILVGIGLISYSAYLWHLPLFAFARIRRIYWPDQWIMLSASILSLILAYLSWRFVEEPFRKKKKTTLLTRRAIFTISSATASVFIVFGIYVHIENGIPTRNTPSGITFADINVDERVKRNIGLHEDCREGITSSYNCKTGDTPEILLWGDSFAMHLAQALLASNSDMSFIQFTKPSCAPIINIAITGAAWPLNWSRNCIKNNDQIIDWLKKNKNIRYVLMSSPYSDLLGGTIFQRDGKIYDKYQYDIVYKNILETVSKIKSLGKTPIIISPPPKNGENIGRCLAKMKIFRKNDESCNFNRESFSHETLMAYGLMKNLKKYTNVIMLDNYICDKNICYAYMEGNFIYRDEEHLSKEGSYYLGSRFDFIINSIR